jgi:hypothetical protein
VREALGDGTQYLDKFREFIDNSKFFRRMVSLVEPREPLAVLCHGDYWTNNILFRYSEEGEILEVRNTAEHCYLVACDTMESYLCFRGVYCLMEEERFFSYPENGGSRFPRNVGTVLQISWRHVPEDSSLHSLHHENQE